MAIRGANKAKEGFGIASQWVNLSLPVQHENLVQSLTEDSSEGIDRSPNTSTYSKHYLNQIWLPQYSGFRPQEYRLKFGHQPHPSPPSPLPTTI
ncbi:hypothetical protein VNO78_03934 [Psophocarpus tetragonolobus]|uniref:Uncharacterized protein n=1 Tax=Psophocarpus tetragonolobus TaxID=3891 RepID=A0AAN9XW02_PSOTE